MRYACAEVETENFLGFYITPLSFWKREGFLDDSHFMKKTDEELLASFGVFEVEESKFEARNTKAFDEALDYMRGNAKKFVFDRAFKAFVEK